MAFKIILRLISFKSIEYIHEIHFINKDHRTNGFWLPLPSFFREKILLSQVYPVCGRKKKRQNFFQFLTHFQVWPSFWIELVKVILNCKKELLLLDWSLVLQKFASHSIKRERLVLLHQFSAFSLRLWQQNCLKF